MMSRVEYESQVRTGRSLSVCFDIAALDVGGMERQLLTLGTGLVKRGHTVTVVVNKSALALADEMREGGAGVVVLGVERRFALGVAFELSRVVRTVRADVVVGLNFNATFFARVAGLLASVPAVTAEHSAGRSLRQSVMWSNRLLAPATSAIVACSHAQVDSLVAEGNPKGLIDVIYNGVDTQAFRCDSEAGIAFRLANGIPTDAFVVGMVASHRSEKRYDRFIELVARLHKHDESVWGLGVGGGPGLIADQAAAASSEARDCLVFCGPTTDILGAHNALDVEVVLSEREALPLATLEGMSCERASVAFGVGGLPEALGNGAGILVEPGDLDAAVAAVAEVALSATQRRAMGRIARERAETMFTESVMVDEYESLLRAVVERAGR